MNDELQINQIYTFEGRQQDPQPEIIITKIDDGSAKGKIFHCYIQGVKMKTSLSDKGYSDHIVHLPFSEEGLRSSQLIYKKQCDSLPNYQEGYKIWLESLEKGKGGIFHIPLKMALDFLEQKMN